MDTAAIATAGGLALLVVALLGLARLLARLERQLVTAAHGITAEDLATGRIELTRIDGILVPTLGTAPVTDDGWDDVYAAFRIDPNGATR
jgi:hypothetical protein